MQYALRGLGFSPTKEEVAQLLSRHARVADASLTQQEFCLVLERLRETEGPSKDLHRTFQLLDSAGTGYLRVVDLKEVRWGAAAFTQAVTRLGRAAALC